MKFDLLDVVRLKADCPRLGLTRAQTGAVVDVARGGAAYTVEFIDEEGNTFEDALFEQFSADELELVSRAL